MASKQIVTPTRQRSRSDLQSALDLAHHYAHTLEAREQKDHRYGILIFLGALLLILLLTAFVLA